MSSIKKIMVAVDFSKYTLPTARYAVQLARELDADLLFVNVYNQRDIDVIKNIRTAQAGFDADQFIRERLRERQNSVEELIRKCEVDPSRARGLVRAGVPYLKLLEVIHEEYPDLLVMATKGRSDLADTALGSCARSMYRRSPIPMLSVRGDKFFAQG